MAKSNKENLFENANAEFKAFEEGMLKLNSREVFYRAFEINAKNEIHGYLCDCATDDLDENEVEVLVGLGDAVIDELYGYFIHAVNASVMFYSDITEWVRNFCKEAMKDEV